MACCKSNGPFLCIILSGVAVITAGIALSNARDNSADASPESAMQTEPAYILDFEIPRINGTLQPLSDFEGKVILLVNVASECGLTPQYEALEALYREKKDEGFVVLAFPANNFGGQEPGTNEQIAAFCSGSYDVTFPLFEKLSVLGEDAHPLYKRLAQLPEPVGQPPTWNFTKYLISKEGNAIARFDPQTPPNDPAIISAIDAALAAAPTE